VKFLDDRPADRICVLAFDDDSASGAVDNLLHQYVTAFVRTAVCLSDVLIPEIAEHIFDDIFEFESREIV